MRASAQRQAAIGNVVQVMERAFRIKLGSTAATRPLLDRNLVHVVKCGRWISFFVVSRVAVIAEVSVFGNKEKREREKKNGPSHL